MNIFTIDQIPDRVKIEQYGKYIPLNTEIFALCETRNGCKKNKFINEVLFSSYSYRECLSFASQLRANGNRKQLTIHNLYKNSDNSLKHIFVCEYDKRRATSPMHSPVHEKYLKDNNLADYAEDDGLTTDMYDRYLNTLRKEHKLKK